MSQPCRHCDGRGWLPNGDLDDGMMTGRETCAWCAGTGQLLRIVPFTLAQANTAVEALHRHHKKAQGHRFSLGAMLGDRVVGAVIVGRPVSRELDAYAVAEVTRLVTDGTKNACSKLYAAAARAAQAMGFDLIQTYILADEPGTSLRAAGWTLDGHTTGGDWNHSTAYAGSRRTDQPMGPKQRWRKQLSESAK